MKEITIISGKGGTGKTSITAAFATLNPGGVICDNDVDAANLHLLLDPDIVESHTYHGAYSATIDPEKCTQCGICAKKCRFDAIVLQDSGNYEVKPFACEGCRLCERVCPSMAISSSRSKNSSWFISNTEYGTFVHAEMGPGEENSGKLVTVIRKKAREIARKNGASWILNDGPPGIGCSAISSITGTDLVVLITEPTITGFHDLKRVTRLVASFNVPCCAIINKYDLNLEMSRTIESYLAEQHIEVVSSIAFSEEMTMATVNGMPVTKYVPAGKVADSISTAWQKISSTF